MSKSPFTSQFMLYLWVKIPSDCKSERKPSEAPQKLGSHARFRKPISKCLSNSSILSKFSVTFAVHWPTFPFNHQPLLPVEHNGPGLEYKLSYRLLGVEDSWKEQMVKRHSFVVRDTPTFVPYWGQDPGLQPSRVGTRAQSGNWLFWRRLWVKQHVNAFISESCDTATISQNKHLRLED